MNKNLGIVATLVVIILVITIAVKLILGGGVNVVIHNVGSEPLQSVVVHVTGNSYSIGDIDAGDIKTVKVFANGESHIEIEHGKQNRLIIGTYFEKSYRGKITVEVTTEKVISIKDEIRIGPL